MFTHTVLLLYPPGFRRRFGPEMIQIFQDSYSRHVRAGSLAAGLGFWHWAIDDVLRSLAGEWRQALTRPRRIELPLQRWADALVVPFTVLGYLMVEGNIGAFLVRSPGPLSTAPAYVEGGDAVFTLSTGVAVALCLAVLGVLSAMFAARSRRAGPGGSNCRQQRIRIYRN